jgi:tetratricopeptide (TPR) repeat protein
VKGRQPVKIIIAVLYVFLISSCAPFTRFSIQVLEPAEITLPSYIKNITFINMSYLLSEEDLRRNESEISHYELYVLDSAINNKFFEGLITGINESPRFTVIYDEIITDRRSDTLNSIKPLDRDQLYAFNKTMTADALISLENYRARDTYSYHFASEVEDWMIYLQINSVTAWSTYDLHTMKLIDYHIVQDTIRWYEYEADYLPGLLDAFREAAYSSGYRYSRRIIPEWYDAERYLYSSGQRVMRRAIKLALSGKWEEAGQVWGCLYSTGNAKIKAKAAFNLAVKYESEDRLDEALEWAERSSEILPEKNTLEYINLLQSRQLKRRKLSEQMIDKPDRVE